MNQPAPPRVPPPPGAPPAPTPPGSGPVGEQPPTPQWRISQLVIPDADASPSSQVITFVVAAYAIGMVAHVAGEPGVGMAVAAALLAGIAVGVGTGASRFFRQVPGTFMGILAAGFLLFFLGIASASAGSSASDGRALALISLGAGAFIAGMDWTRVGRLRAIPVMSAIPVLLVSTSDRGPMLAVSIAWLALAVATLWSLECDQRAAFADPRPLTPQGPRAADLSSRDLVGALGLALLLGLLFAFSATMPSCSPNLGGLGRFGGPDLGGRSLPLNADRLSLDDIRFGNFPFDFDGDFPSIEIDGVEYLLREGASGMLYLENTLTGERFELKLENGNLVARDSAGNVIAVIRPADEPKDDSPTPWKAILAVIALVAVAGLALWWFLKRRKPPPGNEARLWAEDLVARLDRFGRAHGVPRDRSQTVVHHASALQREVAPDERLDAVARVVSDALFGREQPTMEQRLWAEQVVDGVVEAHPPPSRVQRLRRRSRSDRESAGSAPTIERP